MTHYEERLERDLAILREHIAAMSTRVEAAVKDAMHALQSGNTKLAAATVLADHPINRLMRKVDRLCHKFIATHLPSAGHLRLLSSVIRANIELERIGDYAATICREVLQLATPPSGSMAVELERVSRDTQFMLHDAIAAFNSLDVDKARATKVLEETMENDLDAVYAELMTNHEREAVKNLLAVFVVFNQLKRIADQAKNLCEETIFAVSGETKTPKVYNILFLDEDNSCQSQMAAAIARKNFPDSGHYTSGGRYPAATLNAAMRQFLDGHGVSLEDGAKPAPLAMTPLQLASKHVIVSLEGPVKSYFDPIPFHTVPLEWDVGPAPRDGDAADGNKRLEELYREIAVHVRDLMELLRGEQAH